MGRGEGGGRRKMVYTIKSWFKKLELTNLIRYKTSEELSLNYEDARIEESTSTDVYKTIKIEQDINK